MDLTRDFLIDLGGYEVYRHARSMLERGAVVSSNWSAPVLKGFVQEAGNSYRAGLVVKSKRDVENLCSCEDSRRKSLFCAHSVAVGLHHLKDSQPEQIRPLDSKTASSQPSGVAKVAEQQKPPARRIQRTKAGDSESSSLARLFVIFPPNFLQSVEKGRVTIYFEASWPKGRNPLGALPLNVPFHFNDEDFRVLDFIEANGDGSSASMLMLDKPGFSKLLVALQDHPRITIGKTDPIVVTKDPLRPRLKVELHSTGEIKISQTTLPKDGVLINAEPAWIYLGRKFQPVFMDRETSKFLSAPAILSRQEIPIFLSQKWPGLEKSFEIESNFKLTDFKLEPLKPSFHLELRGGLAGLTAYLHANYGSKSFVVGQPSADLWMPDPKSPTTYSTRGFNEESAALNGVMKLGFLGPAADGLLQMKGQNQVLLFFARDYSSLQKSWKVTLEERLDKSIKQHVEFIEPEFNATPSGEQWFDMDVSFHAKGGESFSYGDIQKLLTKGQNYTQLKNGKLGVINSTAIQDFSEMMVDCSPSQGSKGLRFNVSQVGFVDQTIVQSGGWKSPQLGDWKKRAAEQKGEAKFVVPPLGELEKVLRPYQAHGVGWLNFLRENGFGGILADEMGLGKTVQVLAFINSLNLAAKLQKPVLIVCPTTLIYNWLAEAGKFTPSLKVLLLHGSSRHELFHEIPRNNLVITSYGLVRRDLDEYRKYEWDTIVLDEAQHIKNRQTQNAQSVKVLKAEHRLVLTGTPMENSVLDLWSIFEFLMPGYLGAAKDFKERYEIPITRDKDEKAQARLSRRLRPFVLRRLKRDVAKDLPEKIEQVSYCELLDEQKGLYSQVLDAARKEVLNADGGNPQSQQKSRMMVLTALLRLRQICCDLRLLSLQENESSEAVKLSSGKTEMFGELLDEAIDGGHRVLVFSQFVTMLKLLREHLDNEKIEYCYLDGSTMDRQGEVNRFQQSTIPVFLISLKAGGVGLNLTGADTVIHFDPWWNPSIEDQATDRAHRIGQTKVVTVYKLITRGTIEEKIMNLQARKKSVIQNVIGGEEEFVSSLSWSEIQELFSQD